MNILILMGDQHRYDALGCAAEGIAPHERSWLMGPAVAVASPARAAP